MQSIIKNEFSEHIKTSSNTINSLASEIEIATKICVNCLNNSGKILIMGNGGSAADAQHIAAELVGRYKTERKGLPAIALTTDSSVITSIANDYGSVWDHPKTKKRKKKKHPSNSNSISNSYCLPSKST